MSAAVTGTKPMRVRSDRDLKRAEAAIAHKYMGRVPWEMVAWGLGNVVLWLSIWPLTFTGVLPLWAAFLLSTVSITISYLPSHEAQHSIIATEGSRLRWLNELVGHVSTIPLVFPYRIRSITHKQHHAHADDPELDPDIGNKGDTWEETGRYRDTRAWRSPIGTILSLGMEYHIVHHLFPRMPFFQTGPAYRELRGLLDERGCRNDRCD